MQFVIVHEIQALPGRLRARTSSRLDARQAVALARALADLEGIDGVKVNPRTGSVLFYYQSPEARRAACGFLSGDVEARIANAVASAEADDTGEGLVPAANSGFQIAPFVQYFVVRPLLPMAARIAITLFKAVPYLVRGLVSFIKSGRLKVELLDACAIGVSLIRRDFQTARTTMLLLSFGEMLESWTRQQSLASLTESLALNAQMVWKLVDGQEVLVPIRNVRIGDTVIVRAGTTIPVDGEVVRGTAAVNQATMTGESIPVCRGAGTSVFAGTTVEDGEIFIRVDQVGRNTRLHQVVQFISESEVVKASVQGKSERLADLAVPFSFALCGLVWLFTRNFTRVTAVLLVDYACALRMSTPLIMLTAMREGVANGVLIKGGRFIESLSDADTVVFDKTGTLTSSQPTVAEVVHLGGWSRSEVLRLSACLEEHFPHPVARAVVEQARAENLHHEEEHTDIVHVVGHGVESRWHGMPVMIGSRHYVETDEGVDLSAVRGTIDAMADKGLSILYLVINGKLAGLLGIEAPIREEAPLVVARMREAGIRVVMLTGDDERTAAAVAARLGISTYCARILPKDKADIVRRIKEGGHVVAMVGDGINDAPALSTADVGISLCDGTDLAQEVANVILCQPRLEYLLVARHLSRVAYQRIGLNFLAIMSLNSLFMLGGALGLLTPARASLLHNATTICTTINAMRRMSR